MSEIDKKALEALARAYDKEDSAQRGEPDPWEYAEDDLTWKAERLACAEVGIRAYLAATTGKATGEAVGYASDYGLGQLAKRAHQYCLTVSKAAEKEFVNPLYAAPQPAQGAEATHRHVKRGSKYVLLGIGKMQTEWWMEQGDGTIDRPAPWDSVDMREVAIYRSVDDGSLWVRPREEFEDGRFAALDKPSPGMVEGQRK